MSRTIRDYLEDMLTSAALAIDFIQGMSYTDFQQDLKTQAFRDSLQSS
jgi:uncharacterized protein with HEPN domain